MAAWRAHYAPKDFAIGLVKLIIMRAKVIWQRGTGAMMTKQHFIRAAEIVKSVHEHNTPTQNAIAAIVAEKFCNLFKEYNPRFDQQRFLVACGLVDAPPKVKR